MIMQRFNPLLKRALIPQIYCAYDQYFQEQLKRIKTAKEKQQDPKN